MNTRRVLIVFAHPDIRSSTVNKAMLDAVCNLPGVDVLDLYERYPGFHINVAAEQSRLCQADVVVFQHPLFFYSCPALMKEYLDRVLTPGFAFGKDGDRLKGKTWLQVISTGGKESAYSEEGYNGLAIADFLKPFETTASLCQMQYSPPMVVHDAHRIEAQTLAEYGNQYQSRLLALLANSEADNHG